ALRRSGREFTSSELEPAPGRADSGASHEAAFIGFLRAGNRTYVARPVRPAPMTAFTLTPIGTSPAWYNPGEPTSGFLLEADGARVLVDCGSGVISRYLATHGAESPIDAIVLSHLHADHCFDLVPLKYGIDHGPLGSWRP